MFDKLVESNSAEAEFKSRRKFFLVSSVIVGILFVTAVVASIYASDYELGADNFDIAQLLTPITETEPVEETEPKTRQSQSASPTQSSDIVRQVLMASTSDPSLIPDKPSTSVNPYASTDPTKYKYVKIGPGDSGPGFSGGPAGPGTRSGPAKMPGESEVDEVKTAPPAPPRIEKPKTPVSGGVLTGKAKYLPQPVYSAAARAIGAQGTVMVQITVDEDGKVISARALDGNVILRPAAVSAAWKAKFDPTTLTGVPVKVTGIITYNFKR